MSFGPHEADVQAFLIRLERLTPAEAEAIGRAYQAAIGERSFRTLQSLAFGDAWRARRDFIRILHVTAPRRLTVLLAQMPPLCLETGNAGCVHDACARRVGNEFFQAALEMACSAVVARGAIDDFSYRTLVRPFEVGLGESLMTAPTDR